LHVIATAAAYTVRQVSVHHAPVDARHWLAVESGLLFHNMRYGASRTTRRAVPAGRVLDDAGNSDGAAVNRGEASIER
jgi:hypothetical protein